MKASIIIVTHNRAKDLDKTLQSMRFAEVPDGLEVELLVVDNASNDETSQVVRSSENTSFPVRYTREPRAGKSLGINRGLAETNGDIILFTDDDVRLPVDWMSGMCGLIAEKKADAVAGGVCLAPHLIRPWMTPTHRSWLASTEWLTPGSPASLVGANMGFSRKVLERVPGFEPELGPGASGFNDDHLFALQLGVAGFRIADRLGVTVEHHFDPSRLTRESWLSAAERRGSSQAYVGHHWEHWRCRFGAMRELRASLALSVWRTANSRLMKDEGCSEKEMGLVFKRALAKAHVRISARPRKYERHGLRKIAAAA